MVDLLNKFKSKNGSQKTVISIVAVVLFIAAMTVGVVLYSNNSKKNETTETEINALEQEPENTNALNNTNNQTIENNENAENTAQNNNDGAPAAEVADGGAATVVPAAPVAPGGVPAVAAAPAGDGAPAAADAGEDTYFQKVIEEEETTKEWENVDVSWEALDFGGAIVPADTLTRKAEIRLTKNNLQKDAVTTGDEITYTVEAENIGNIAAKSVVITDKIDTQAVEIVSIENDGIISEDGVISWNVQNINENEKVAVNFTVKVKEVSDDVIKDTDSISIANKASISGENIKDVTTEEVVNDYVKEIITGSKEAYVIRDGKEVRISEENGNSVLPGETLKYKVELRNEGTLSKEVNVEDVLPESIENVAITSTSNGVATISEDLKLNWNVEVQKRDENKNPSVVTLEYTATVKADATGTIKNSISIDSKDPEATVSVPVITSDKKSVIISSDPENVVTTGTILRYEITVNNTSDELDVVNVTVTDKIPQGVSLLEDEVYFISDNGKVEEDVVTWNIDVEKSSSKTVSFYVVVNENDDNTNIENIAKVNGNDTPKTTDNFVKAILSTNKAAYVTRDGEEVEIVAGSNVAVVRGETIKYRITVQNEGSLAKEINVEDVIPNELEDVTILGRHNGSAKVEDSKLSWNVQIAAKTEAGASIEVLEYTARVKENATGNVSNSVIVDGGDPETTVDTPIVVSSKTATIVDANGDALNKNYVTTSDRIKYTITVSNTANVEAKNITVKDMIPQGTHLVDGTITENGNVDSNVITWNIDSLTGTKYLEFIVEVEENENTSAVISNTAYVNEKETETVETNYEKPNFTVEKTANKKVVKVGENITYTLKVTNTGKCEGTEVVTDTLPQDVVEVVEASGATIDGNKLSWNVTLEGNNDSTEITYTVKVKEGATSVKNSVVTEDGNTDEVETPVVEVSKTANTNSVKPGSEITYIITVTNRSNVDATNIDVKDELKEGLSFVSSRGGNYSESSNTVVWENQTIKRESTNTYEFTAKVNENVALGTKIYNVAVVDNTPTNTVEVAVEEAKIEATKTVSKEDAKASDTLTYTIVITNSGNKAGNITLKDIVPEGTTYVEGTLKLNGDENEKLTITGNEITLNDYTVESNSEDTLTFDVTINDNVNEVIKNKATYKTDDDETETDEVVTTLISKAVKDENGNDIAGNTVKENDVITYEITVNNTKNTKEKSVQISDTLPAGVEVVSISDRGINNNNTITWNVVVPADSIKTVNVKVKVNGTLNDKDTLTNTATVDGNNTNTVENIYVESIIDVSKSSSIAENAKVARGSNITYTLKAENKGGLAKDIQIIDSIPANTTFVSADDGIVPTEVTNNDGTKSLVLTWNVTLPAYSSVEKTFTVKVNENTTASAITNKAIIDSKETNEVIDTVEYPDVTVNMFEGSTTISKKNIVMVLDMSSSMASNNRLEDAKKEAVNFVKNIYTDDSVTGVNIKFITFNFDNSSLARYNISGPNTGTKNLTFGESVTTVTNKAEADALIEAIEALEIPDKYKRSGLGTDIEAALTLASSNLSDLSAIAPKNQGVVVFLGDGEPDGGKDKKPSYDWWGNYDIGWNNTTSINAKADYIKNTQNAEIYTIGFYMNNSGKKLMSDIATPATSDKTYAYTADNSSELTGAFEAIKSSIRYTEFTKTATEGVLTYTFDKALIVNESNPVIVVKNGVEEKYYSIEELNNSSYMTYTESTKTIVFDLRNENVTAIDFKYNKN